MALVWGGRSQASLERAAHQVGFLLTVDEARELALTERTCLSEQARVSFGEPTAQRLMRAFAGSPFISRDAAAEPLRELTESFFVLREDFPAAVVDEEIIEALREAFDSEAAGDARIAAALAGEALKGREDGLPYTITDDEGETYRWDPQAWHDDVMADGWYGERWEDVNV